MEEIQLALDNESQIEVTNNIDANDILNVSAPYEVVTEEEEMFENCMIRPEVYLRILNQLNWKPKVDICTDKTGGNSLCALFYSKQ